MTAKKRVLPMLFAMLLTGGASVAHACDWDYGGYGYGWGRGMMGMGPGMMGPGMIDSYGAGPGMFDLTEQQQNKMALIQEEAGKRRWDLIGRMNAEQIKLQQLYYSGKRDSAAIDAQYKKIYQLQREMNESWMDAQVRMDALLTKEQKERHRGGYGPGWMMR